MQKLYNLSDLAYATGINRQTIGIWAENGWLVPCEMEGGRSLFFHQSEYDRLMAAVAEAAGAPRQVHLILNRTLHTARKSRAINTKELSQRCGCCRSTLHNVLASMGYSAGRDVGVLEEDVPEVKANVTSLLERGKKSRKEGQRKAAALKTEATGGINVHLKGLTISLTREDAEALAEELISQL